MKKEIIIAILIVASILIGVFSYSQSKRNETVVTPSTDNSPQQTAIDSSNWSEYVNNDLGVAIKYPQKVTNGNVKLIHKGNIIFVTTDASPLYQKQNELLADDDTGFLRKASEIEGQGNSVWAILVRSAKTDSDLEKIIQDKFGKDFPGGCKLGSKSASESAGILDVNIDPQRPGSTDKYDSDSSCWINWRVAFKYSPEFQRAAIWDMGQEGKFLMNCESKNDCAADDLMVKSFRFLPK